MKTAGWSRLYYRALQWEPSRESYDSCAFIQTRVHHKEPFYKGIFHLNRFNRLHHVSTKFHLARGQDNFWCKFKLSGALLVYFDWCKMNEQYERDSSFIHKLHPIHRTIIIQPMFAHEQSREQTTKCVQDEILNDT